MSYTPEQRMIARLCGCLKITLRKYKIAGITGTAALLDEALEMLPDQQDECDRRDATKEESA